MRGHIKQRSRGSWSVVINLGRDLEGKSRQKWYTVHGTKREAEKELSKLLHELEHGIYVEPHRMTVAKYLEKWLSDYAEAAVAPKTYERYAEICTNHLIPALGAIPLAKLQPLQIQSYYSKAQREVGPMGRKLSKQTVLHHHRIFRSALKQAVKWQLIVRNPADAVEPPAPERKEMVALNEHDTAELLKVAEGSRLYAPMLLAVTSGLRRGEVLGLHWADVDLEKGTLSVRHAVEQTRKGGVRLKQPKSKKSRRTVALLGILLPALRRHKTTQNEDKLRAGAAYTDTGLVFAADDGEIWNPDAFTKAYRDLVRRTPFKRVRFHDLRHTHATQLLRQGIHPKVVSERLGHSTIALTLDTYSHVLPRMDESAAAKLNAALRDAIGDTD
jgi:integrase